jgi:hypothetical protein
MTTMTLSSSPYAPRRSARPARPSSGSTGALRLTVRGRVVALLMLLVIGFAALSIGKLATSASPVTDPPTAPVTKVWVVAPGETLWSIATRINPDTDPRATVQRIVDLNSLGDAGVFAGERLIVPARG